MTITITQKRTTIDRMNDFITLTETSLKLEIGLPLKKWWRQAQETLGRLVIGRTIATVTW